MIEDYAATWQKLIDDGTPLTYMVTVGGETVPLTSIVSFNISHALYTSEFSVGSISCSCMEMKYMPKSKPAKAAEVVLKCHAPETESHNAANVVVGRWYINLRKKDTNGFLSLTCYDKVYKLEKTTVKKAANKRGVTLTNAITATTLYSLARGITGLSSDGIFPDESHFLTATKEEINRMTLREALSYATKAVGVSMIADPFTSELREVRWSGVLWEWQERVRLTGWVHTSVDEVTITDENKEAFALRTAENMAEFVQPNLSGSLELFGTYPTVTKITVSGTEETEHSCGASGYNMEFTFPFASADTSSGADIAGEILYKLNELPYTGWEAVDHVLNPGLQVGDFVVVSGKISILASIEARLTNSGLIATVGACGDYEVEEM